MHHGITANAIDTSIAGRVYRPATWLLPLKSDLASPAVEPPANHRYFMHDRVAGRRLVRGLPGRVSLMSSGRQRDNEQKAHEPRSVTGRSAPA